MKSVYLNPRQQAFTLIELMIVIAIIAILATVAIPSYNNYTKKAAISELLAVSSSYKTDVEICVYNTGALTGCNGGVNGIKADRTGGNEKYLGGVNVKAGVITVSGKGSVDGYSYTMTPSNSNNNLTWKTTCSGADISLFPASFCTVESAATQGG